VISPPVTSSISTDRLRRGGRGVFSAFADRRPLARRRHGRRRGLADTETCPTDKTDARGWEPPGNMERCAKLERGRAVSPQVRVLPSPLAQPWCEVCACCRLGRRCGTDIRGSWRVRRHSTSGIEYSVPLPVRPPICGRTMDRSSNHLPPGAAVPLVGFSVTEESVSDGWKIDLLFSVV